jgi:hypothetical protein
MEPDSPYETWVHSYENMQLLIKNDKKTLVYENMYINVVATYWW